MTKTINTIARPRMYTPLIWGSLSRRQRSSVQPGQLKGRAVGRLLEVVAGAEPDRVQPVLPAGQVPATAEAPLVVGKLGGGVQRRPQCSPHSREGVAPVLEVGPQRLKCLAAVGPLPV